jgi:hypothetical protein
MRIILNNGLSLLLLLRLILNKNDSHSHLGRAVGAVKNCDNFRIFRPFYGRRRIVTDCDRTGESRRIRGRRVAVKNRYRG